MNALRQTLFALAALALAAAACSDDSPSAGAQGGSPDADLSAPDADLSAPDADLAAPDADLSAPDADLSAPDADLAAPDADAPRCEGLFGRPNAKTGLDETQCQPVCAACAGAEAIVPLEPTEANIERLLQWTQTTPDPQLLEDPYTQPTPDPEPAGTVCAVLPEPGEGPRGYALQTFPSRAAAEAAQGFITHTGACGLCSNLHNLAVYLGQNDLTDPVRACGLRAISDGLEANVDCLLDLGFDRPCAQIWAYNTTHTRERCLAVCMAALNAPYHNADGTLNDCLQCDEDLSGPVFKKVAGRTRRNSGLANSMCRPCAEVEPIAHDYH